MTDAEFEDKSLGKIAAGLRPAADRPLAEIKADLVAKGYNPDAFAARLEKRVSELTRDSRLAWQKVGDAKQKKANAVIATIQSWAQRSVSEIDRRDAWRLVRSESPRIGRWTPEPVLMAYQALLKRRTWEGAPSPLADRLSSFKARKHNGKA